MRRTVLLLLAPLVFLGGCPNGKAPATSARPVSVSWAPSPETAANGPGGGYRVYYSQNPDFSGASFIDVPYSVAIQTPTALLPPLPPGTYFVRVMAYSSMDGPHESSPSMTTVIEVP